MNYLILIIVFLVALVLYLMQELCHAQDIVKVLEKDNDVLHDRLKEALMTDEEKRKRYKEDSESNEYDQYR